VAVFQVFSILTLGMRHAERTRDPFNGNLQQNHNLTVCNKSFDNVSKLMYQETTITNRKEFRDEVRRVINSGNAYYHSILKLISKMLNMRTYKLINLHLVCICVKYGILL
jgi:hypothetical protein